MSIKIKLPKRETIYISFEYRNTLIIRICVQDNQQKLNVKIV